MESKSAVIKCINDGFPAYWGGHTNPDWANHHQRGYPAR